MPHEVRDIIKRKIREQYVEKIVKLCEEILLSQQVEELFELAKKNMAELDKKGKEFEESSLYHKIQNFDKSLKLKPIFKDRTGGYDKNLLDFDTRINAKALFFLILSMDQNTEDSFFENPDDFVFYLKNIGEDYLASYVAKNWLYGTISRTLWDVYDEDD